MRNINDASMKQSESAEVTLLHALCVGDGSTEQRAALTAALGRYAFLAPENQVIFESIRALPLGSSSPASLSVHLNNRGFPDLSLDRFFSAGSVSLDAALKLIHELHVDK